MFKKNIFFVLLLVAISCLSLAAIFQAGMMMTHDGLWQVQRATLMYEHLKLGQFPVRWVFSTDNSYGIPLFNFVYPGPYYLASIFMAFGIVNITAIKLVTLLAYMTGGIGMYYLFSKHKIIAFITALIYLLNPYQFVNIFVRGALGETLVIALAPWLFLATRRFKDKSLIGWEPLILGLALISHNFLGLLLTAMLFFYGIFIGVYKRTIVYLALGIGVASFFLVPMIMEKDNLLSASTNDFSYIWSDHFIYPKQLLYSRWDYWYSMPGGVSDGMTFQLGFVSILALALYLAWYLIYFRKEKTSSRFEHGYWLLAALMLILSMIPSGRFIWELFPILQTMQFPWRLLGLMTVVTGIIVGNLLTIRVEKDRLSTLFLSFAFLSLALINTRNYHRPLKTLSSEDFFVLNAVYADKTTTSSRSEVMPRWAKIERYQPTSLRLFNDRLGIWEGNAEIRRADMKKGDITFVASAENERAIAVYYHNYYPSWALYIDGVKKTLTVSETGEMLIPLVQGEHNYRIKLEQTIYAKVGNLISVLSLLLLVLIFIRNRRQK